MRVRVQNRRHARCCPVCGIRLSLIRRLTGRRFCCESHEEQYLAELRELGVQRLINARQDLDGAWSRWFTAGHRA